MKGIGSFFIGALVGAAVMFSAMKYHIVRADDGLHMIPKLAAEFGDGYVDIRQFDLADWDEHRKLAAAIIRDGQGELIGDSSQSSFRQTLEDVLSTLGEGS